MTNMDAITGGKPIEDVLARLYAEQGCPTDEICEKCELEPDEDTVCYECWSNWLKEEYKG